MSHILKGKSKPRDPLNHSSDSHVSPPGTGGRLPTPSASLFTSLSTGAGTGTGAGATANSSTATPQAGFSRPSSTGGLGHGEPSGGLNLNLPVVPVPSVPSFRSRESTRTTDRTDALWAEMQATLEAVELSAGGGGGGTTSATTATTADAVATSSARVFGPDHERKLDELRAAQIALAQAWARSEADEAIETTAGAVGAGLGGSFGGGGVGETGVGVSEGRRSVATDLGGGGGGKSTVGTGSAARPGSSGVGIAGGGGGQGKMEEETEVDILLARKRREANDRYFQRVNQGVLDVVAKLEDVAIAMRAVEQESKELWGEEDESVQGSTKT
ncbi:hypothetical protein C7999DRAFT_10624 [Corynascus novoguineensis]|uniref:Uncharacterized protein n=1 Tax=Corynascus novoguineensis TaxID=1126955 RepID=A0AAN7D0N3_9PEZI|nr:hypothetical protein C7999DRAFT_10624 [Corynascus novoguineensis]